jgi:hypothetical protein
MALSSLKSQVKVEETNAGKKKIISEQELNQPRHTVTPW